jgi:hypothetical protein
MVTESVLVETATVLFMYKWANVYMVKKTLFWMCLAVLSAHWNKNISWIKSETAKVTGISEICSCTEGIMSL